MQTNTIPSSPATPDHQDIRDVVTLGVLAGITCFLILFVWQRLDDNDLSMAEVRGDTARPWPESHPLMTALIVCSVVTIGLRLYLFMRRLEDQKR
jgi:hypothetical protein